ncbi:MAG: hypothetical protein K2Y71_06635 [Xanthobacteraceae bacterium]|nr:hypothetical protein [Xanthobacteraceae bacterium]
MNTKIWTALFCAAAFALSAVAVTPADAQAQPKAQKRVAAKKYGPVPISMAPPPRARVTVTRRTFLDAGTHVIPGDRKFTDYALPPTYYPAGVADNRGGMYISQSALPGPFTLPGRDNPWPWNPCVGC